MGPNYLVVKGRIVWSYSAFNYLRRTPPNSVAGDTIGCLQENPVTGECIVYSPYFYVAPVTQELIDDLYGTDEEDEPYGDKWLQPRESTKKRPHLEIVSASFHKSDEISKK